MDPRIPAPIAGYKDIRDAKDWLNPRVTIHAGGAEVVSDGLPTGRKTIPVTDLRALVIALPVAAWPYGRVVLASDTGLRRGDRSDDQAIKQNHDAADRILKALGLTVDRWPSAAPASGGATEPEPAVALARAEARWHLRGAKAYKFGILLTCECFPRGMTFRVVDRQVQPPRGADAATLRFHDRYGTVEKLFAVIRGAIAAGGHRIVVKYDSELGYPIWADLDPRRQVIDDERFFRVTGFRTLESPAGSLAAPPQAAAAERRAGAALAGTPPR
jgi:hypothetical protein